MTRARDLDVARVGEVRQSSLEFDWIEIAPGIGLAPSDEQDGRRTQLELRVEIVDAEVIGKPKAERRIGFPYEAAFDLAHAVFDQVLHPLARESLVDARSPLDHF